jgi:hypothetical protein
MLVQTVVSVLIIQTLAFSQKPASTPPPALSGFPFTDEDLNYSVNWPSGINLGEAHLHAKRAGSNWNFSFTIDAGVPGFQVKDAFHAESGSDFCCTAFDRSFVHGMRSGDEKETIDRDRGIATRVTKSGGQSDVQIPKCVKDALTFLLYTREEMGQGRVPPAQQILYGGLYRISLTYAGAPMITINRKQVQTDELVGAVKSQSGEFKFEVYFARDPARSPLVVKAPFAMGTFSMELISDSGTGSSR